MAYFSRKIIFTELNYNIYDKELLVIVEVLKEWRVYLQEASFLITILTNHKNLICFIITKNLNR
jgi:hypothetical protein